MVSSLVVQIISAIIAVGLTVLMVISKRVHYFVGSIILVGVGVVTILDEYGITNINLDEFPVVNYAVYFMILFAGKDLLKEGFKEKQSALKYPSIILALLLIIMTTLPTLNKMNVIDWALPKYPPIVDAVIYIVSGIFLLIGVFTLLATHED
jgi:hypothetical protein